MKLFILLFLILINPLCYYVTNTYSNFWTKIVDLPRTIKCTILCIRFPFLYPRNRFTGTHWYSYDIRESYRNLYVGSIKYEGKIGDKDNPYHKVIVNKKKYYLSRFIEFIHDYVLQIFFCIPTFTELDSLDKGWRKKFGMDICKEIRRELLHGDDATSITEFFKKWYFIIISANSFAVKFKLFAELWQTTGISRLYSYRITQIKEKYGSLRWYDAYTTKNILNIIDKYEDISAKTCIACGDNAEWETSGWIAPYCDKCVGEKTHAYKMFNNKRLSMYNAIEKMNRIINSCESYQQLPTIDWCYGVIDRYIANIKNSMSWYKRILFTKELNDLRFATYDYITIKYRNKEDERLQTM